MRKHFLFFALLGIFLFPTKALPLFLAEAGISYDLYDITSMAGSSLSDSKIEGVGRIGLDATGSLLGAEVYYNLQTITSSTSSENFKGFGYGVFAGYTFLNREFKAWGTYIIKPLLTSDVTSFKYSGHGYKLAGSYKYYGPLYIFLELNYFVYDEYKDQAGTVVKLIGKDELVYESVVFGVMIGI